MRPSLAGPYNSHSTPGRTDFTPFRALPGEKLAPVGRIARLAKEERVVSIRIEEENNNINNSRDEERLMESTAQTSLLALPVPVLLFILSLSGIVVDVRSFCALARINKRFLWMVRESETTDRFVWRQHCIERWRWLQGLRPAVSWYALFKRYWLCTGPPIFAMEVVFGCDDASCAMYQCEEACSSCNSVLPTWKAGSSVIEEGKRYLVNVTGGVATRAIAIAVWLYKKGYRGFVWKSKEEYDEWGPNIRHRPCF